MFFNLVFYLISLLIACFCLFMFRGFRGLFFILYSAGIVFLFLLFLTFLGWVDLGGLCLDF
ncbi:hypothetical protein HPGAM_07180 [Helicobacter pylori Gambia94/24]|nr:hypothetical protein HPGAM_07180 [Helicobacter pylori Gambia94/24]